MCVLGRHVVFVVVCNLFVVEWRRRVECVYYLCKHGHTQKKIAIVIRGCRRNEEVPHIILHDAHKLNDNGYIISYVAQTKHILMLYNVVKSVPYFVLIKDYAFYFLILWRLQYKAIQA
jgi:hypothetical protein